MSKSPHTPAVALERMLALAAPLPALLHAGRGPGGSMIAAQREQDAPHA